MPLTKDYFVSLFVSLFVFAYLDLYFGFVLGVVSQFLWSAPDEGLMCTASGMEALDNRWRRSCVFAKYKIQNTKCKMQNKKYKIKNAKWKIPNDKIVLKMDIETQRSCWQMDRFCNQKEWLHSLEREEGKGKLEMSPGHSWLPGEPILAHLGAAVALTSLAHKTEPCSFSSEKGGEVLRTSLKTGAKLSKFVWFRVGKNRGHSRSRSWSSSS